MNKHGDDVRETLQWLDEATSKFPYAVTLQGGEETYQTWDEVERFAIPRTLFSENDTVDEGVMAAEHDTQDLAESEHDDLTPAIATRKTPMSSAASADSRSFSLSSLRSQLSSLSIESPPTSPAKVRASPENFSETGVTGAARAQDKPSSGRVPARLQALFSYILWRIHQEVDPVAALESFIFLCNDQDKVRFAKGFEIKTKRLEQLRDAVNREDRDFKNRTTLLSKENQKTLHGTEDDEVVFKPPPRAPAAMLPKPTQRPANMIDPDTYDRIGRNGQGFKLHAPSARGAPNPPSPICRGEQPFGIPRRGNPRANFRGSPRGRGNAAGRGGRPTSTFHADSGLPGGQIDPNSFARPRGSPFTGRGGRKLWVPT